MTEDNVNRPAHYNKNGIEVIDVIETYTPNSPHLANVLKYVCRHSYKGKPLEDLKKARWYLDRAIVLLEEKEARDAWVEEQMNHPAAVALRERIKGAVLDCFDGVDTNGYPLVEEPELDEYGRVLRASPPVNIDGVPFETHTLSGDLHLPPDRIPGDDDAAERIKNHYYDFDPFASVGYCANCEAELSLGSTYISNVPGYEPELKFCSDKCVTKLREWQGRTPR